MQFTVSSSERRKKGIKVGIYFVVGVFDLLLVCWPFLVCCPLCVYFLCRGLSPVAVICTYILEVSHFTGRQTEDGHTGLPEAFP